MEQEQAKKIIKEKTTSGNKNFCDANKKIPDQSNDPGLFTNQKNLLT